MTKPAHSTYTPHTPSVAVVVHQATGAPWGVSLSTTHHMENILAAVAAVFPRVVWVWVWVWWGVEMQVPGSHPGGTTQGRGPLHLWTGQLLHMATV